MQQKYANIGDMEGWDKNTTTMLAGQKMAAAWRRLADALAADPQTWLAIVGETQQKQMQATEQIGKEGGVTAPKDRRFAAEQWHNNAFFSFLMQNYLLGGEALMTIIERANVPEEDKKLLRFAARQYVDAVSPANFPMTNPEVLEETAKTGGQNFVKGMQNFAADMQSGGVSNTDKTAFTIGENIACTAGKVIFQNEIMQLIEYAPQTSQVYTRPLLIVPPCINKYYILDLQQHNSFVGHAVASGQRVFLVSWVSAGESQRHLGWDYYLREGVMSAIEVVSAVCGREKINALGFCIGGTLLTSALAILAAGKEHPAQSLTLLATLLDFSESGEIGLFIDDGYVSATESRFAEDGGVVNGGELARGFATLRPNDLIWPYFINNYYRGQKPQAFDLLYWNSDSVNLPGPMFAEYLRACYLENRIAEKTAVFCDTEIDVSLIDVPSYVVACEKDHIAPWQSAYTAAGLLGGKTTFTLAASGHIAGIVNPPSVKKGWHATSELTSGQGESEWRTVAKQTPGSWWDDWLKWLSKHGGKKKASPKKPGSVRYAPIEDAPGGYVRATSNQQES